MNNCNVLPAAVLNISYEFDLLAGKLKSLETIVDTKATI